MKHYPRHLIPGTPESGRRLKTDIDLQQSDMRPGESIVEYLKRTGKK